MSDAMDGEEVGPIDPQTFLQSVLHLLQQDPGKWWRLGIYWWPVKLLLKRAGYTKDNLYLLGSYVDPETAEMVGPGGLKDVLTRAKDELNFNLMHPHSVPGQVENETGELVIMVDADSGGVMS